jgi:hypothetical protein
LVDDDLMSAMNSIEVADRQRATAKVIGEAG